MENDGLLVFVQRIDENWTHRVTPREDASEDTRVEV